MNSEFLGISGTSDPKSVNLKNVNSYTKKLMASKGFDHGAKMTKKARKGFPYEALVQDSLYFAAYKQLYDCVDRTTEAHKSLTISDMEEACGEEWKRLRVLGVSGELRYTHVNSPYFQSHLDAEKGFR
ncbi:unnamed protein product [Moneuplotes crassus]|uniref:Uncharacterized protein n=1 Tax=Euplotes crassus TaxID=5936 RepID=A0AAD1Y7J2_EUPCR|nr:unnamed protein product [Moneuplotes crassus]